MNYFNDLVSQSIQRAREATLSILSVNDKGLREHLASQFSDELGADGCFLAPPVFEHTFGWQATESTLSDLVGESLFSEGLLDTLQAAPAYQFSGDMRPYAHQLDAWKVLTQDNPRSAVITSGTGSGKTECFMLPILNDLIHETETTGEPLVGVRALFLYPLNALINSQQERLDAWTQSYRERIRFCLYNGMTEQSASRMRKEQHQKPNQILSRELLRAEPAPILMTNSTMLEYMLVRQVDSPILDISREAQSLRWIVLDEAHTYIGSQAAEMSLLLRRVVQAFGRKSSDIRFVATSATISGEDSQKRLARYLADLAGVDVEQVSVIGGNRIWPSIERSGKEENRSLDQVANIELNEKISLKRHEQLVSSAVSNNLRDAIVSSPTPLNLNELVQSVEGDLQATSKMKQQREVLDWLNLMANTYSAEGEQPFVKLRCHLFQRMLHGVWACVNPACSCKSDHLTDWPFGNVYVNQRARCNCGAPVFELTFCKDCSSPHLLSEDINGQLSQLSQFAGDEFSLNYDESEEDGDLNVDDPMNEAGNKLVIGSLESEDYIEQNLNLATSAFGALDQSNSIPVRVMNEQNACCSNCRLPNRNISEFYRRAHLGAPFYVANVVPTVLEFCPDPDKSTTTGKSPEELPGRGRKLITFTDSRQGTARMAVRMQQEAERSRLRGLVFEVLRNAQSKADAQPKDTPTESPEKLLELAKNLEDAGMRGSAQDLRNEVEQMTSNNAQKKPSVKLNWDSLTNKIASSFDISQSILDYNKYTNPEIFEGIHGSKTMAHMLLAREFSRRPKNQNSLETLGLVAVGYQGIDSVTKVPRNWEETKAIAFGRGEAAADSNLTLQDWKDFLVVALDFHVRENTYLGLDITMQSWMGGRFRPKVLFPVGSTVTESSTVKKWPQLRRGAGSRLVKLLQLATNLSLDNAANRDQINYWLKCAFEALVGASILEPADSGHRLNLNTLTFSLPSEGWVCSSTHKFIPTTFRSLTPYLPRTLLNVDYRCERRELPDLASFKPDGSAEPKLLQIRQSVEQDAIIRSLRAENLWTDISDRTVEGGFYYRTAEHSAQQSSKKLERYEELFKKGKVNVLNCSTTMEMGVDIGGISAVVMNNVPPHPANYLQRAGRAGRRSESKSISYTLCKADPHNQRVFKNPQWPFKTVIPAPHITLSSDRIVQRHVNSYLLSVHLRNLTASTDDSTKLSVQWFFGGENSPCKQFIVWLRSGITDQNDAINELVKGTALANLALTDIVQQTVDSIATIQDIWLSGHEQITHKLKSAKDEAYKRALEMELKRHENEFLLRDIAAKAFSPGHGFPTDVVSLNTYNIEDFKNKRKSKDDTSREDNVFNLKEQPSRGLNVAIREYAPGAQVVIDGRVYNCAGVSLQWHPNGTTDGQKMDVAWRCRKCGATGLIENAYTNSEDIRCTHCDSDIDSAQQKTILKPLGFLTDFYQPTSNDVTSQKYMRVEKPRVQLESNNVISLPDPSCGFIRYGHSGSIVYHSSGEHEKGFAVCLSCGKSESMSPTGQIPANLGMRPDEMHRAVGGLSASGNVRECSGASVKADVYLGYQVKTDVVEFYIRNPLTNQWLSDSDEDRIIATTMAVAIREVIAGRLGINSTEMGFGIRPDKDFDTGAGRSVIQLYDLVSGGAGFVLAELGDSVSIIKDAVQKLVCSNDCENVCTNCLASKDSQVEREHLDRKSALQWFNDTRFFEHLTLPDALSTIEGAQYCSMGPKYAIEESMRNYSVTDSPSIFFALTGDINEWDLDDFDFRSQLLRWVLTDKFNVWLGIPDPESLSAELTSSLATLQNAGVKLALIPPEWCDEERQTYCVAQIKADDVCQSLFSLSKDSSCPGNSWLDTNPGDTWVRTDSKNWLDPQPLDYIGVKESQDGSAVIEIKGELDGDLKELPERLRSQIAENCPQLMELLQKENPIAIRYSDRYLKSPWSVLMLSEFLNAFKTEDLKSIIVETVGINTHGNIRKPSSEIVHDWIKPIAQKQVISDWITASTSVEPSVKLHKNVVSLQHGRSMWLEFASGAKCTIRLDQGVDYWQPSVNHSDHLKFNFSTNPEHQSAVIGKFRKKAVCKARAQWSTFIAISIDS